MARLATPLNEHKIEAIQKFTAKLKKKGFSASRLRKALLAVIEYNIRDEENDFYDPEHDDNLETHILGSLIVLEEFRKGLSR